ncbi:GYF domain-containing protein [Ancylobacter sp. A5.8]|uniref:DUF4339 domain-containing protein n=1 Tax=Ancylobacter gelatini TaxID=2919920 RepID=UPI001F4E0825|nr:GYF domain-containing protein [Ancylobacter gelatini]MCJ8142784.1 GYF domain-containing protein [Ancylobacter gelatini]
MADEIEPGRYALLPAAGEPPTALHRPPPHPLDGEWHLHIDGQVFGPFSGHQLRDFAREGRLSVDTDVARLGDENWVRAADDKALAPLFGPRRDPSEGATPPPGPVSAGKGATVVQVTNHIAAAPEPKPVLIVDAGDAAPKSAGLALVLSILIVGLGQLYNGQIGKGLLMFIGCIVLWFVFLGWIINIWSWIDAYQTAKAMNARYMRNLALGVIR